MKEFSIFERALALLSLPKPLAFDPISSISRRDFAELESFICLTTSSSIEYACLMIENALLLRTNRGGRVYAGFEKLSGFQPVIDRYLRIADISEAVYLFGKNDWQPPRHPNLRLITLNEDCRLARDSFLIAHSSNFNSAFIATRNDGLAPLTYLALKTSDDSVVLRLSDAVEGVIDWSLAA